MLESRRLGTARQRNVDFMRDLGGNLVVSESGDQAYHSVGDLKRDDHEVGIAERGEVCQTVETAASCSTTPCSRMSYSVRGWIPARSAALVRRRPPFWRKSRRSLSKVVLDIVGLKYQQK